MLEKNLIHIAKYNPELAEKIKNHNVIGNFGFDQAQSGDIVLFYENIPFHSMEDPQQEAMQTFNNLTDTGRSAIHIIFGLGLGYLFKRIYLSSEGRLVVFEPNLDILRITLENVDFSTELADSRVMILQCKEELEVAFQKFYLKDDPVNMCFSSIYKALFPDLIQSISQELGFLKGAYNNNYYTLFQTSKLWLEMALNNYNDVINQQYVDCLKDKFKGIPAIIASAGPSLLKNIEQLEKYQDQVVLFSVGASLRLVKEVYEIKPNFSVFIDVSAKTAAQLDGVKNLDEINFITQPSTYKKFYEVTPKRNFIYLPVNDFFSKWMADRLKLDISNCFNRGTVTITAFYNAMYFGCDPIILMGQDLAYANDGKEYADEKIKSYYDPEDIKVSGWNGEMLQTNSSFLMFKRYYENIAKEFNKKVRIINCSEGGAFIEGVEHMTFSQACQFIPDKDVDVEAIISQAETDYINPLRAGKLNITNALKKNYNSIPKLLNTTKKAVSLIEKIEKEFTRHQINKTYILNSFKELYENNGKIDRIINEDCPLLNAYIQQESYSFKQNYNRYKAMNTTEDMKLYLDLSKAYYEAIIKNTSILSKLLAETLKV